MDEKREMTEILIVEDSSTQAEKLKYILEENGFHVFVAYNGKEAFGLLGKHKPAVVISDVLMPEMDGYQLCKKIKNDESLKDTPVILLTALSDTKDVLKGLECNADNFVTKPYEEKYLISKIRQTLKTSKLRKSEKIQSGVEIVFSGQKFLITSERRQILDLLLSTYETAVRQNLELMKTRDELNALNEQLEQKVERRTAALNKEIIEHKLAEDELRKYRGHLEEMVEKRTQELKEMSEELARSNADLQQFAYAVSHDLQEPLQVIKGFLALFEKRYKDKLDEKANELVRFTIEGAKRMQELIKDLLEYSRVGTKDKRFKPTDCSLILDKAIFDLKVAIEESRAEVTHDSMPTVMANAIQLSSLFQNLIGNAIKFQGAETPRVHISAGRKGDEWLFSVRDNGIGIDPKFTDRIFNVFQRLHSSDKYPGTGIGLAICKKIVERHGGRIWVESKPGKGATFYFTIPERQANPKTLQGEEGRDKSSNR